MGEEEWVNDAMKDDLLVVELLMRLKQSEAAAKVLVVPMTPLEWGVRLPRSRQVIRCNNILIKKEGESTRASPTTPLSWSGGGTSVSGGGGGGGGGACVGGGATVGDGFEESSKPVKRPGAAGRSNKANGTNESTNRRSRKKKTYAELKEEESLLLKERIYLEKERATLVITRDEQEASNIQLKRLKLDLQLQSAKQAFSADVTKEGICNQSGNSEIGQTPMMLPMVGMYQDLGAAAVCPPSTNLPTDPSSEQKDIETRQSLFELPDLNVPLEEDSGSEVLYGMS